MIAHVGTLTHCNCTNFRPQVCTAFSYEYTYTCTCTCTCICTCTRTCGFIKTYLHVQSTCTEDATDFICIHLSLCVGATSRDTRSVRFVDSGSRPFGLGPRLGIFNIAEVNCIANLDVRCRSLDKFLSSQSGAVRFALVARNCLLV